jgi:hypothetical protein
LGFGTGYVNALWHRCPSLSFIKSRNRTPLAVPISVDIGWA